MHPFLTFARSYEDEMRAMQVMYQDTATEKTTVFPTPTTTEMEEMLTGDGNLFVVPYQSHLCLSPLIERIEKTVTSENTGEAYLAREVLRRVAAAPELSQPVVTVADIEANLETVELMMLFLFPAGFRNESLFKISRPFHFESVYQSRGMETFMATEGLAISFNGASEQLKTVNLIQPCLAILRECYGKEMDLSPSTMLTVPDAKTGLTRFFKPQMNQDFIKVNVKGNLPPLSEEDFQLLLSNIYDRELWLRLLPPEKFEFHGFMFGQLSEVTEEESLSQLKYKLIKRDAVIDIDKVKELADLLRIHFNMPDLQLGLTAVDFPVEYTVEHQYKIHFNLLSNEVGHLGQEQYATSIYHRAFEYKEVLLVEDLTKLKDKTELEEKLLAKGFKSILLAPLLSPQLRVIGLVELAAHEPFALNSFLEIRFREIMSLFRTAVARSREEVDNRLEAILRDQYTSLHPSIEWRFMEAAYDILEQRAKGGEVVPQTIAFEGVYPIYGQADIVSSSRQRNEAIHGDLIENLEAAKVVLVQALGQINFPLVKQVVMEIEQHLAIQADQFNNSDETTIVEFLYREVNPLIRQLGKDHMALYDVAQQYLAKINNELDLIYHRRQDYEQSVATLNKELSRHFEKRDKEAQKILPHYFEKYKTDGVEYEIYAGQSLLRNQEFSEIHLRNLRLGQLIDMCEATRLVERISEKLPLQLATAQLIFAYTSPLNIRFRMDEKRFDVDGAYNVRYEILKKRIDKATIKKGSERLTQAGMVSIVYLHDKDKKEYGGYLDYLRQSGYLDGEVEQLKLDPLQSVQGLKALRFKVAL